MSAKRRVRWRRAGFAAAALSDGDGEHGGAAQLTLLIVLSKLTHSPE
jgi:hypothetical protein